jgi:hypothetical protein
VKGTLSVPAIVFHGLGPCDDEAWTGALEISVGD